MPRLTAARFAWSLLLGLLCTLVAATGALAAPRAASDIVQLRPDVSLTQGRTIVRAAGGRTTQQLRIVHGLAVRLSGRARTALAHDPRVRAVSRNAGVRPQWQPPSPIDSTHLVTAYPFSVRAPGSWSLATGAGVGVAVIDTGIAGGLPDFAGPGGTSRVIASAVANPDATTAEDTYGHGTHVAGIIAGNGDNRAAGDPLAGQYLGIAPQANLISVKAGDDQGNATILDVIDGLQFVVDHQAAYNIRVVNLSLESTQAESYRTDPLDAAVESAYFSGIVVVAAAGNRGTDPDAVDYAPGNDPFVLSVGAVDDQGTSWRGDDVVTDWSSTGQTQDGFDKPEIVAPGAHIVSTLAPGSTFTSLCPSCVVGGQYIRAGGTSMAAPVVSGAAALLLQLHPDWTPDEVKSTLVATARPVSGGADEVNVFSSLWPSQPYSGINDGIEPNDLVDSSTGAIDYTRSSWSRSSWSTAPDQLTADWSRSSWSCVCGSADGTTVDPSRSSWSRSSWSTRWGY
jgi:serine protease AprX